MTTEPTETEGPTHTPEPSPAANPLPAPAESLPAAESPNPGGTALEVPPRPVEPPQPPSGGARREPEGFEAALREIDARPEAALALAEQCLRDEPSHVPSHVLRLSALHRLNRPRDFRAALEEARNAGAAPVRMDLIPHFRRMLDEERRAPILPKDVYAALTEGLSLPQGPPGRRPGG